MVGNVRGTRTNGANRNLRVPPARRVDNPRGTGFRVTPVSPRAIAEPHHGAVAALLRKELEHVRRSYGERFVGHDHEERLQIKRNRPKRVRPSPPSDELQIPVDQRMTEPIPHPARHRHQAHQQRETSHDRTLAGPRSPARYDTNITRVLGDRSCEGSRIVVPIAQCGAA
jgi:hypothetical protein